MVDSSSYPAALDNHLNLVSSLTHSQYCTAVDAAILQDADHAGSLTLVLGSLLQCAFRDGTTWQACYNSGQAG